MIIVNLVRDHNFFAWAARNCSYLTAPTSKRWTEFSMMAVCLFDSYFIGLIKLFLATNSPKICFYPFVLQMHDDASIAHSPVCSALCKMEVQLHDGGGDGGDGDGDMDNGGGGDMDNGGGGDGGGDGDMDNGGGGGGDMDNGGGGDGGGDGDGDMDNGGGGDGGGGDGDVDNGSGDTGDDGGDDGDDEVMVMTTVTTRKDYTLYPNRKVGF